MQVFDASADVSDDVAGCHVSCKGKCCKKVPNEAGVNSFEGLEIEEGTDDEAEAQSYPETTK